MAVLHILSGGTVGGIEVLCKEYGLHSKNENIFVLLWNDGPIAKEMRDAGLKVVSLNASKRNVLGTVLKLVTICKEYDIKTTVVHHAAPIAHLYLLFLKKCFPNMKTVGYAHGNAHDMCPANKKFLRIRKDLISASLKKADRVIAISQSVKESCIEYFNTPEKKIEVVYNGVDVSKFVSKANNEKHISLKIVYVGRLIKNKGVQNTLEALTLLPSNIPYQFSIIGDGPYRKELERIVDENKMTNVYFLGERRDVISRLQEADVFIHIPVWKEGFGITVIEAMASGLICICGNSGALPEIITDGKNGFLVENDIQLIARTIVKCFNLSDEEKKKITVNAIKRANDFSIDLFAKKLDELLL